MTPARWTFVGIFGICLLLGLGMGVVNLIAPGTANITLNGAPATGMSGVWTALLAWGIPGLIFGLIIAGIVALFTRKKKAEA
jgi:hypothetical protein